MKQVRISESLDYAISMYLDYKDKPESPIFNSFFVVVVRILCVIYDELDIINPYLNSDDKSFNNNLCKFGYELDKVLDFKYQLDKAYELENNKKINSYFFNIQKILIDMLMMRKDSIDLDSEKVEKFYALLYTPENKNPLQLSYNYMNAKNPWEVDVYFKEEMIKHQRVRSDKPKVILNPEVYPLFGVSMEQVNAMSADYLDLINHQIYLHFGIKESTINKEYLLEKEIEKIKHEKERLTSGNGYVDILLVMGVICTIVMLVTIAALLI